LPLGALLSGFTLFLFSLSPLESPMLSSFTLELFNVMAILGVGAQSDCVIHNEQGERSEDRQRENF
jgi:hypothetical protein